MSFPVLEHVAKSARHTTFYLSCGAAEATPIIFVHGWPELSISWREQLPAFGGLGFRAVAPDMRGYGRSSVHPRHEDYALGGIVADMVELLGALGAKKAIWVGHDWGAPVVWSIAQQHPELCHGVANLCVPYKPEGFAVETVVPLADRSRLSGRQVSGGAMGLSDVLSREFRCGGRRFRTRRRRDRPRALPRRRSGGQGQAGAHRFHSRQRRLLWSRRQARARCAARPGHPGRGGGAPLRRRARAQRVLRPMQLVHELEGQSRLRRTRESQLAARDAGRSFCTPLTTIICETTVSRLAEPMRAHCDNLTEATIASGHWMAQEKPVEVNAALAKWLAARFPALWAA